MAETRRQLPDWGIQFECQSADDEAWLEDAALDFGAELAAKMEQSRKNASVEVDERLFELPLMDADDLVVVAGLKRVRLQAG